MRGWMLGAGLWALAGTAAGAMVHTTDADFLRGSGDGNVDIGAGDGDGSVRLAKLAGTLGAWTAQTSLPTARAGILAWTWDNRIYIAAGHASAVTNTIHSADIDGSGNLGAWSLRGSIPSTYSPIGITRWGDRLYMAGGVNSPLYSNQVLMATLGSDGMPGPWVNLTVLPSADYGARILADKGWLYYFAGNPGGVGGSNAIYAAPIRGDGSLGAWVQRPQNRNQILAGFSVAAAMGSLFVVGGELGNWFGESSVDRSIVADDGSISAWTLQSAMPAPRSWNSSLSVGFAGKLWQVGGKTSGSNIIHHQTYSSTLGAGGVPAAWAVETGLPAGISRSSGSLIAAAGRLWHLGGSNHSLTTMSTVHAADLNAGSVNAAQGVYVNRFDLGSDQALGQLAFDVVPAGSASVQVRSALQSGTFGGWTSATTGSPISLTWTGRYVEYRVLFNDSPGDTVRLDRVELVAPPAPTATPTPVVTSVPSSTPSEADSFKGGPFKGAEGEAIAFPNPAKGAQTQFGFTLEESGTCTLSVWTAGGVLASQASNTFGPGKGLLKLNIKDYAPGVYLYQLEIEYLSGRKVSGPIKKFAVLP